MAGSSLVVHRCTNCGQEYDLALVLTECKACYQPLGYWCTRDSELSGSWLPGPECRQCTKREERNRRRREQRRRKREGADGAATPATGTLFDGLTEETARGTTAGKEEKAAGTSGTRRGRSSRSKKSTDAVSAGAKKTAPSSEATGGASSAAPPSSTSSSETSEAEKPSAAPASSTEPPPAAPSRPMLGSKRVTAETPHIASVNSAGVVRRCTNCGTEYAPLSDHAECAVCFSSLGWWCRTHSPAGGAWLSGSVCPLCALAPPSPRPAPRPRPPIIALPRRRPPVAPPRAEEAPPPAAAAAPYFSTSLKALAFLYAIVFLMALTQASAFSTDAKMLGGLIAAGVTAIALRFRVTAALIVIGAFAAFTGFVWLMSQDPLAAGVFALGSLAVTRLRRTRGLAVSVCYLAVLYGFIGVPVMDRLGVERPSLSWLVSRTRPLPTPSARPVSPPGNEEPPSAMRAANPDLKILPTRISSARVLPGHNAPVYAVTYMPGGRSLLSLGQDNTLRTWNLDTGAPKEVHGMPPMTAALQYDYSDDGNLLGEVRAQNPYSVLIWNSRNNTLVRQFDLGKPVTSIAFSPPGVTLAAGTVEGVVEVYDVTTGKLVHRFVAPVGGPISALAFSTERNLLAAAGSRGVAVWDFGHLGADLEPTLILSGVEASRVIATTFTPGGRTLMTVHSESNVTMDLIVRYWDTASGALLRTVQSEETVPTTSCAIRPDGRQLACTSRPDLPEDSKIYVYDLTGP